MSKAGWALVEARDDVEGVSFVPTVPKAELHRLLEDVSGVALGVQPFSDPELEGAIEKLSRRVPMRVEEHEIVLHGSCPDCGG